MSLRCQSRIQIIGVSLHGLQVDGDELFGGLSHEPVRNTDAMIGWGCMNADGASPTVFSVIERIVSGGQKIGSASEKSVWVTPTIVRTRKNIVWIVQTIVKMAGKMVAALEKSVAKLENIFWQPKTIVRAIPTIVRTAPTIVKTGRCLKPYVSNDLMSASDNLQSDADNLQSDADNLQSDADHCRRASDYLLRDQENSRSHHENLLVRAGHVLRNPDYCLDDSNSLQDDGDHRHGRTEDGVFHGKNPLKSAPRASFTNIRANFYPHDWEKTLKNKALLNTLSYQRILELGAEALSTFETERRVWEALGSHVHNKIKLVESRE